MNKVEMINIMSERTGLSKKDSLKALDAFIDSVTDALVGGDKVQLVEFGTFDVESHTVKTGKVASKTMVSRVKVPVFTASKTLEDKVNGISK
jgi:DNA-binding protein HU-beta